jgi:hypothetical protein
MGGIQMSDTLKVVETKVPEYSDSYYYDEGGYDQGYVILEATVSGKTARFKVPAYENSNGDTEYEWNKITRVEKVKKTVEVWE